MIDFIRAWITSVTAAAIIVAICAALTPKGVMKKYVQFTGGLVLLLVIINPVFKFDAGELFNFSEIYNADYRNYEENLNGENTRILKIIIEEKTESYILGKASELGIDCTVKVGTKMTDGYPYPYSAQISPNEEISGALRDKMTYYIESELAIPRERQIWD